VTGSWRLAVARGYFRSAGRLAPRRVGRQAFELCFTPARRPEVAAPARELLNRAERLSVMADGRRMRVYRWPARPGPSAKTVLLVHGWTSRASRLVAWVEPLLDRGFGVVACDLPAHGDSEGSRTNGLEMATAVGVVAEAAGPLHGMVGHSAGAFAAAMAVAGGHLLGRPPIAVERLVMIAAVDNPRLHVTAFASVVGLPGAAYREMLGVTEKTFGHPMEAFSLSRIPGGWRQPTLLIHDPADPEVPYSQAEAVAAIRPNVTLLPIDGLGHHRIARDPTVIAAAIDFLSSHRPGAECGGE